MKFLKNFVSAQVDTQMMYALKGGNPVTTVTYQTVTPYVGPPRTTTSQQGPFSFGYEANPHDPSVNTNPNNP